MHKYNGGQLISEMKQLLSEKPERKERKLTIESMVFDDDYGENDYGEYGDEMPKQEAPREEHGDEEFGDNVPEAGGNTEIGKILSNIRLAVIKGLAQLASKPDSIEYDTLKKILVIVDKPIEKEKTPAAQQPMQR